MQVLLKILVVAVAFLAAPCTKAGLAGWLTSSACSWSSIQDTGGVRIGEPVQRDGKLVLPVEYDPSGVAGVTHRATRINSGLVVRKVQSSSSSDSKIVIKIYTQVAEENSDSGRIHYAELDDFPPGSYTVYYEDPGDPAKKLGRIQVN